MTRRQMRTQVFKELYFQGFFGEEDYEKQCRLYLEDAGAEESMTEEEQEFLKNRACEIVKRVSEIDAKIDSAAIGWKTERMGRVDLSILRLAVYEAFYDQEIPEKVAFNEAVELAKTYGTDESPAFINGILGKLAREAGQPEAAPAADSSSGSGDNQQ